MNPPRNVDGQAVALLAELADVELDADLRKVLDEVFARKPDGTVAHPRWPMNHSRREDLTRLFTCCSLGWLYLASEPLVLWTTHDPATARESFNQLADVIDAAPVLRSRVARIKHANGDQEIRLADGPRLMMRTRNMSTRGYCVSRLILDEADYFTERQAGMLFPAMAGQANHQILYGYPL